MSDQPRIVARAAQPYVAVTERVTLDQFPGAIDRGFAEVFGWLAAHDGVSPAAAPLIRYVEVDMAASLLVDLAVPVEGAPLRMSVCMRDCCRPVTTRRCCSAVTTTGSSPQMPRCSNGGSSTVCAGLWTAPSRGARGSSNISPTRAPNRTPLVGRPRSRISSSRAREAASPTGPAGSSASAGRLSFRSQERDL